MKSEQKKNTQKYTFPVSYTHLGWQWQTLTIDFLFFSLFFYSITKKNKSLFHDIESIPFFAFVSFYVKKDVFLALTIVGIYVWLSIIITVNNSKKNSRKLKSNENIEK